MKYIQGKLVLEHEVVSGTIGFENGKIISIKKNIGKTSSLNNVIYRNCYILPGLIEVHGHMREPGLTHKEDVPHGTRAALAGGVTTVIDMPNTNPPTVTVKLLDEKIKKIYPNRSYTDYAFFMGVSKDSIGELEKVDPSKIAGVKVFMAGHETVPTTIPDDETLRKIMSILAKRDILLSIHAEDQPLINYYNEKFKKEGRSDPALWSKLRPKNVVVTAVKRAISLASTFPKIRLYFLHLSTPEEFDLVHSAQKKKMAVYGELVGYQLIFTIDDYQKYGNRIKVAPALRTKDDQKKMWQLVYSGGVDVICSEHTPHEWETKNQPDVWKAKSGTPGIQETLPALITGWLKRFGQESLEQSLLRLARYTSYNPAQIFGFHTKGSISAGKDADLTIINVQKEWKVEKKDLFTKCGWSPYEGMTLVGRPVATYLRGQLVYQDGSIIGKPSGKWLKK